MIILKILKILHILAAVVLLGNLIMAPFWRKRMAISDGLQARADANRSVRVADFLFTLPGWVVGLVTGLIMAIRGDFFRSGGWLHVSVLLFLVWLVAWHAGTMRARKAMIAQANEAVASGQATEALTQHERQWARWSYISALVAVLILILMVVRPF